MGKKRLREALLEEEEFDLLCAAYRLFTTLSFLSSIW
jgi:hypothetical protein